VGSEVSAVGGVVKRFMSSAEDKSVNPFTGFARGPASILGWVGPSGLGTTHAPPFSVRGPLVRYGTNVLRTLLNTVKPLQKSLNFKGLRAKS